MIRNNDVIEGYTILATANGMALAHSKTAPDPYVVWFIDEDGCGVRNGRYQQTKEDAEWDFCCKAFPWFEDNAPVNMIEDEAEKRIQDFNDFLDEAKNAVEMAKALVEDMVLEHGRLQGKKEAPQEESAEHKRSYSFDDMMEMLKEGYPQTTVVVKDEEILLFDNRSHIKADNFIIRKGKHSPLSIDINLEEDD